MSDFDDGSFDVEDIREKAGLTKDKLQRIANIPVRTRVPGGPGVPKPTSGATPSRTPFQPSRPEERPHI
ncbi:MAG: hypothetical protein SFW62_01435 [Alphaproteobacteria bacterium]|nr:hypothetical protein [Alphaproteobacteria bacterium]